VVAPQFIADFTPACVRSAILPWPWKSWCSC